MDEIRILKVYILVMLPGYALVSYDTWCNEPLLMMTIVMQGIRRGLPTACRTPLIGNGNASALELVYHIRGSLPKNKFLGALTLA